MFRNINKIITLIFFNLALTSNVFGISDNFKFVIDTIGIPRYNVYMEEINEDIYYTYNIFVYSNPQSLLWHKSQRFKNEPNQGKWTRYNGAYKGIGERGEYYLLGASYSGFVISNVYFPPDFLPETTPDKWIYLVTSGAYESWINNKYPEQLEYMKHADMLFDEINYENGTINSYNLISYGISVNKIGMDKITLDTASTWKTNGVVTARRLTPSHQVRNAIFTTKPMAANADVISKLRVQDSITLEADKDEITLPIKISAEAINLSNYANKEHIKEIVSTLYINNKEIAKVSGSKTVNVDKEVLFTVSRQDYNIPKTYPINIKVKSYLYTEFSVDGLMQDEVERTINLHVKEKQVIPIKNIKLSVLEKQNNNLVVRPLVQTMNSDGIIETGKFIAVRLEKGIDTIDIDCYINETKTEYEKIYNDENYIILKIVIDESIRNTINSWSYLRNRTHNYFEINFNDVGKRVQQPNVLKIKCNSNYEETIEFDTIDKYLSNMNYLFENNVLNANEVNKKIPLKDWIKYE